MFVGCECCVLSGRGLCEELITRPEESYRLCCAHLLRLWVRIPPGAWMFVVSVVLSSRGLCEELITRPEDCGTSLCVI